jgi:hypothetical protein
VFYDDANPERALRLSKWSREFWNRFIGLEWRLSLVWELRCLVEGDVGGGGNSWKLLGISGSLRGCWLAVKPSRELLESS